MLSSNLFGNKPNFLIFLPIFSPRFSELRVLFSIGTYSMSKVNSMIPLQKGSLLLLLILHLPNNDEEDKRRGATLSIFVGVHDRLKLGSKKLTQ